MAKSKTRWLDRTLMLGPYLALCTSEERFKTALRDIEYGYELDWIKNDRADATLHHFDFKGKSCNIVCIRNTEDHDGIQVAALLLHEAVHIWQGHCRDIGEHEPSAEFEAYSIQAFAQFLMYEFARQANERN